jgi:hypothetical protein
LKTLASLEKFSCKIFEAVSNNLSDHFNLAIGSIEESCNSKKEDSDWEGFEEKFKQFSKEVTNVFRSQINL